MRHILSMPFRKTIEVEKHIYPYFLLGVSVFKVSFYFLVNRFQAISLIMEMLVKTDPICLRKRKCKINLHRSYRISQLIKKPKIIKLIMAETMLHTTSLFSHFSQGSGLVNISSICSVISKLF